MKYSCNYCNDQTGPCIVDVQCVDPEPPCSCIYAKYESDMDAEWKPVEETKDFERNGGICADCLNCAYNCDNCKYASGFSNEARQQHDAPLMSDNLRSAIDAANKISASVIDAVNKISAIKNGSQKDPKSRYYGEGGFETLDIIKAKLTPEQFRGFLLGNIIKYSCRANYKGEFDRDIEKVRFYGAAIFGTLLPEDRK